jgi:hypothetical protein
MLRVCRVTVRKTTDNPDPASWGLALGQAIRPGHLPIVADALHFHPGSFAPAVVLFDKQSEDDLVFRKRLLIEDADGLSPAKLFDKPVANFRFVFPLPVLLVPGLFIRGLAVEESLQQARQGGPSGG